MPLPRQVRRSLRSIAGHAVQPPPGESNLPRPPRAMGETRAAAEFSRAAPRSWDRLDVRGGHLRCVGDGGGLAFTGEGNER